LHIENKIRPDIASSSYNIQTTCHRHAVMAQATVDVFYITQLSQVKLLLIHQT